MVSLLLELAKHPFSFPDTGLGPIGQRLARTNCRSCKKNDLLAIAEFDVLTYGNGETAFAPWNVTYDDRLILFRGSVTVPPQNGQQKQSGRRTSTRSVDAPPFAAIRPILANKIPISYVRNL